MEDSVKRSSENTPSRQQSRIRGIDNVSNVSCHISCAIQILCHAIPPIQQALVAIANERQGGGSYVHHNMLIKELVEFVAHNDKNATADDPNTPSWDPGRLYKHLQSTSGPFRLDYEEPGDPSTSLVNLLHLLKCVGPEWDRLLKETVWQGQTRQILKGRKQRLQRVKVQRPKSMSCPLVLEPVSIGQTVQEMLLSATEPNLIQGSEYPWDSAAPGTYTDTIEESSDLDSISSSWITTKHTEFCNIPDVWLLHLTRPPSSVIASSLSANETNVTGYSIGVPFHMSTVDLTLNCMQPQPERLVLQGAILQVVEIETNDYADNESNMEVHCVALLRDRHSIPEDAYEEQWWVLVDDNKLEAVSNKQAQELLNGTALEKETDSGTSKKTCSYYGASLLAYSIPENEEHCKHWTDLADQIKTESDPSKLIGRRLSVRWAKGNFFPGTIVSYDPESGKHTVEYDDGDTKDYMLAKKSIEWEEP